jgi:hypothetical protein
MNLTIALILIATLVIFALAMNSTWHDPHC